ncbi:Outer membrane efflux protein [Gimesia panareensis]|uniref:Outer membrane efflux protein n=1 Tax=Gimesia panareensis TaxID=2527978 RepID=A0A517QCV1_9PLAN|nr:TolC family protein [Gimesia panareensis]QDT29466.1 Outer membrane efflux protein [Gimesia panareensis]
MSRAKFIQIGEALKSGYAVALIVGLTLVHTGCSPTFWADQANSDSYDILAEKSDDPAWELPRVDVDPDPRSRFYDPYDPNHEPLPPDDPAANVYMHWLQYKKGYKSWHKFGRALSIENPDWLVQYGISPEMSAEMAAAGNALPGTELPALEEVTLREAIDIANINSREYQFQIENLFLSALDLTLSRFQFDVKYLGIGGQNPQVDLNRRRLSNGTQELDLSSRMGVNQMLPSGAQWAVEIANNTLWLFSGSNSTSSVSVLSYSLVQPLLLGAGRKVVLNGLTQSERDVLYQTRTLARFRKTFFTDTVGGGNGFLQLLQQLQVIYNQRNNIKLLERQVEIKRALSSQKVNVQQERLEELPDNWIIPPALANKMEYDDESRMLSWKGEMSEEQEKLLLALSDADAYQATVNELISRIRTEVVTLDVAQLETQLASSINTLRTAERRYQDSLGSFKIFMGLPPDMPLSIDESLLKPFQLIDPLLPEIEQEIYDFVEVWATVYVEDWEDPNLVPPTTADMLKVVNGLELLIKRLKTDALLTLDQDIKNIELLLGEETEGVSEELLALRQRRFESDADRERVRQSTANDIRLYSGVRKEVNELQSRLDGLRGFLSEDNLSNNQKKKIILEMANLREDMLRISQGMQVIEIGLRVELITLEPFTMNSTEAVRIGLDNRLDLMNQRAFVMDARRLMEVQSNQLEAVLNVVVDGDVSTPSGRNRPLDFRGSQASLRAGVEFTAPLSLVQQRNAYRESQIDYQRQRRTFMEAQDNVKFQIRQSWRQLNVLRQNFETSRVQIRLAALQYDSAVEATSDPAQAGRNQGLNLLNALSSVLTAQNSLISNWVNYEQNRLNIYRDMGIMEIDANGIWEDNFYQHRAGTIRPTNEHRQPPPPESTESTSVTGTGDVKQVVFRPAAELNALDTETETPAQAP